MSSSARSFLLVVAVLLLAGTEACAPGIRVTRLQPSRYNLGTTRRVAVLEVNGNPNATPLVISQLQKQILDRRFYSLINAVNRGLSITVTAAGTRIDVGGIRQQVDADVYVNAMITRYDYSEVEKQEEKTEKGRKYYVTKYQPEARVRVNFQVVKSDGQVIVLRDYDGDDTGTSYEAGRRPSRSATDLLESAARESVGRFLDDITPHQVVEKIELDESDDTLKPGIKMAEAGDLAGAERSWNDVLARSPNNAGAIYNVGVLLETRGEFDQAAGNYTRAFQLNPKGLYHDSLEDLNRRLADAQALQQQI
jgi:tetratricopeptide (TPR) repeat protein